MVMEEYPSDTDYRIFVEKEYGRDRGQEFLRDNKNFLVHTHTKSNVANIARRLLFGLEETEKLKEGILAKKNPEKSTALIFESEASEEELEADLSRAQSDEEEFDESKELSVSDTTHTEEGIEVELEYIHRQESQRNLMNANEKETSILIEETGEEDIWRVSQDYRMYDEFNAIKDFFEGWRKKRLASGEDSINMGDILLERLSLEERVDFFNDILTSNPGNWRFDDAIKMGIRQGEDDAIEEMFDDEDEFEDEIDENLRGITSAALSGEGLRTNGFVQKCIDNGYYFESGKLLFKNTDVAEEVEILIEFKKKPKETFDVSVENEYDSLEDGREETIFESDRRKEIRDTFRDLIIELYGQYVDMPNLIQEKTGIDELTEIDGVGESTAQNLREAGFESVRDVLEGDEESLLEVDDIGEEKLETLKQNFDN